MPQTLTRFINASLIIASVWLAAATPAQSETPPLPKAGMAIEYLEIVTTDVDATCTTLAAIHAVEFGAPEPGFGNARIATLSNGGRLGVRAPLSDQEGAPTVRPYLLVNDIETAISDAEATGAEFAMLATEIPGHGKFAIYFQGGVQYGLWEK